MNYKVSHLSKIIECQIDLPTSKSISNRVLIIQALCKNTIRIKNLSNADDTVFLKNAIDCLLEGKENDKIQKPSIGCNIKWK